MKALLTLLCLSMCLGCQAQELYRVTAYCACKICCGKYSDGRFADGTSVVGWDNRAVANNWLEFGTAVSINGKEYIVKDRGSKKYFGSKEDRRLALDVYKSSHQEAKEFGVQYLLVKVLEEVK